MKAIEDFFNKFADADWTWWPLLSLRPARDKRIDNICLLKMTASFGTFVAFCLFFLSAYLQGVPWSLPDLLFWLIVTWVVFFVLSKFTFAYFWNRRAARSKK